MRYFSRPTREAAESGYLATVHDKVFEPFGQLGLGNDVLLDTAHVDFVPQADDMLAIAPESASWAVLNKREGEMLRTAHGRSFGALAQIWPTESSPSALDFVAHLYRRGLLFLDGRAAVDPRMFVDGPNYDEGNLIELLVTEKCNLACPYCLAGANQTMPHMKAETAERTIDLAFAMREARVLAFEFAGGEPFLRFPLMQQLADYIESHPKRAGRQVFLSVQTNATMLDEERVRWLRDHDVRVGISLDGPGEAQNISRPQVNGGESFSKMMRGLELLQRFEVPFGALVVLNRANIGSAEALVDFLISVGVHGFRLNPVTFLGQARQNWEKVGVEQHEVIEYFNVLMTVIAERRQLLLEDNVRSMLDFLTSKQRRTRCMRSSCGAGDTFQAVVANGDIYPCGRATQSPGLRLGNVFDEGIESLSAPARQNELMDQLRSRRPADFDDCSRCSYRQLCQSGCSAQAWERHGTVRHKTPECAFYKTLYPSLMSWLSKDAAAFDHLNRCSYFSGEGARFDHEFLPVA